ncbi:GspH/FimT family pseudopilin [Duganella violaceipulchra]|uniref:GspH/FimT family pseudopilin n=1 Tax=Duganella violaceipulchra TaxID=2849652 RepID=A0AA41HDK6_9BURK|nr:GspH/FimT family pseudopilin [Duganella violaceicalia]MBV6324676.1 GspH/FimT family pseudopilin [Duganella violaceicalia]MCP2009878.1 type IV fimbrial biogenesis protein FimT [Duganella violaceicalia]
MRGHPFSAAFSLVELLIVLLLATILLGVAVPNYRSALERQQLRVAVNDLVAAINLTRSHAIARGGQVLLVPLEPGGAAWRLGWMVFIDENGNRRPDPGELLLFRHGAIAEGVRFASVFSSGATPQYLAYNAAGRACSAGNSLAARWGTLSLTQGDSTRNIKINMLGRVRVCDPAVDGASCTSAID